MAKKPKLELVGPSTANPLAPPATLGKAGREQWEAIQVEYAISDSGGLALLLQACAAIDEIAECTEIVTRDGHMVRGKSGTKEHPLLRHSLALRAFHCRTLQRLGLNLEPLRPEIGRPPR